MWSKLNRVSHKERCMGVFNCVFLLLCCFCPIFSGIVDPKLKPPCIFRIPPSCSVRQWKTMQHAVTFLLFLKISYVDLLKLWQQLKIIPSGICIFLFIVAVFTCMILPSYCITTLDVTVLLVEFLFNGLTCWWALISFLGCLNADPAIMSVWKMEVSVFD